MAAQRMAGRPKQQRWRGLAMAVALGLVWCAASGPAFADRFTDWLAGVRADARAEGIRPQTLDAAFAGVAPLARVIELDRKQPETTLGFVDYLDRVIPQTRIDRARDKLVQRRPLLDRIAQQFGVAPRFIVALWGIESDFGQQIGGFSVIGSLATLAYDGRRSAFFRRELIEALHILDKGEVTPAAMKGSWAGAMGQSQFMPSTFQRFAVDYDGDGRRDIWTDGPDLFASIANYLAQSGWQAGETWGRPVILPVPFDPALASPDIAKPIADWTALGVRAADGGPLPSGDPPGSLLQPGGSDGPAFLIFENFRVLLRWNRSNYFATAVGLLADRIE
jgi:membrane-bound lytic murein transglycosylase B